MKRSFRWLVPCSAALIGAAVAMPVALHANAAGTQAARWTAYGRKSLAVGRVQAAEKAFGYALDYDPKDLAAWAGLADSFKREGLADKVLNTYAQMIQAVPGARTKGVIVARGWRPLRPHMAGYYLYVSETPDGGYRKVSPLLTGPAFKVDGLVPGLRYYLMVTVMDDAVPPVESKPSAPWSVVCQTVALP
jgi:hypothetical protein